MKTTVKLFILITILLLILPIKVLSDDSGYLGIEMYRFTKPKIAKEIVIVNVFPYSLAWKSGIRLADRILKVNDIDVSNSSIQEVQKMLAGKKGEVVKLTLWTKSGIKNFTLKREFIDISKVQIYPKWQNFCYDKSSKCEACFIHSNDIINKKFELGEGALATSIRGRKIALKRYQFENNMQLCSQSKDPNMCFMQLKQSYISTQQYNTLIQQQAINGFTQNLNQINTNLEIQNINNSLQNTNFQLQNINNTLKGF